MPKTYSLDFRNSVLNAREKGMTFKNIKTLYGVCAATVWGWENRKQATGNVAAKSNPGRQSAISTLDFALYMKDPENQLKTQAEIAADYKTLTMTISNMMRKIGYTRKKRQPLT